MTTAGVWDAMVSSCCPYYCRLQVYDRFWVDYRFQTLSAAAVVEIVVVDGPGGNVVAWLLR
ncbi:hypothetical protein Tdes44962_MAKER09892 [Teratosphaeria destructans]|uniref:Uncharacterized protein n=1 Tax=Teratosphaeria destructans TaxID=418781 RepID=A0A9W7W1S5_9PEZI|nr:hypothetical protein Tdes44962_MAKER09892 [Teratosphaeria destructans]